MRRPIALAALLATAILLSACALTSPTLGTAAAPRTVELTMTDHLTCDPARTQVRRGETIKFVVRNASSLSHEAYIGTEQEQRLHETVHTGLGSGDQASTTHMGYGIHVDPLGRAQFVVTFDQAYDYLIGCHYPGHYAAGMRAVIEVAG